MNPLLQYDNDKFVEPRGSIYTLFDKDVVAPINFVQDKVSRSKKDVIRGFHGDPVTWKYMSCLYGKIRLCIVSLLYPYEKYDLILDAEGDEKHKSVLLKPYTINAHHCLSDECILYYKLSHKYSGPGNQWSVKYDDPDIGIDWGVKDPIISDRDRNARSLAELKEVLNEVIDY